MLQRKKLKMRTSGHISALRKIQISRFHPSQRRASSLKLFRAHGGILARTLWWDDLEGAGIAAVHPAFGESSSGGGGGGVDAGWEILMHSAEARHCLRQLVREAMGLADFFAKDNPPGKVSYDLVLLEVLRIRKYRVSLSTWWKRKR